MSGFSQRCSQKRFRGSRGTISDCVFVVGADSAPRAGNNRVLPSIRDLLEVCAVCGRSAVHHYGNGPRRHARGGNGNDNINGGNGNDSLAGGTGNDAVLGGDGSSDNRVPEIRDVRLPSTVGPGDTFTVEIDIKEFPATGVSASFRRSPPDNWRQVGIFGIDKARLVKGYVTNATDRQTMRVVDWAPPGTNSLLEGIQDPLGNRGFITTEYTITVTE